MVKKKTLRKMIKVAKAIKKLFSPTKRRVYRKKKKVNKVYCPKCNVLMTKLGIVAVLSDGTVIEKHECKKCDKIGTVKYNYYKREAEKDEEERLAEEKKLDDTEKEEKDVKLCPKSTNQNQPQS